MKITPIRDLMLAPSALPSTLEKLRAGELALDHEAASQRLRATGAVVVELIRAAMMGAEPGETVVWAGSTTTMLELADSQFLNLELSGTIHGGLMVSAPVSGGLSIGGHIAGGVKVHAPIAGELVFDGQVDARIAINAPVSSVRVTSNARINHDVFIHGPDTLESVRIEGGATIRSLCVDPSVRVGSIAVGGAIAQSAAFNGPIENSLTFTSTSVVGQIAVTGPVGRLGQADSGVKFNGTTIQSVELHAERGDTIQVASFYGAHFDSAVQLGDGVSLHHCEFRNFTDFDKLQLLGADLFARDARGRQIINAKIHKPALSSAEQATIYRRLRRGLEQQGNRPAAADFYYGESEARRQDAKQHFGTRWSEYLVLTMYRTVSGYGTRALYAIGWFTAVALAAAVLFAIAGVDLTDTHNVQQTSLWSAWPLSDYGQLLLFSTRSMVSFFSPPQANLTAWEQTLQLVLRFVGPLLIAQAIIAVRERVAR